MGCIIGKRSFDSEELALEALIQNHIRNDYRPDEGPKSVYQCLDCGDWHFTSKGEIHPFLANEDIKKRIDRERRGYLWEQKLK